MSRLVRSGIGMVVCGALACAGSGSPRPSPPPSTSGAGGAPGTGGQPLPPIGGASGSGGAAPGAITPADAASVPPGEGDKDAAPAGDAATPVVAGDSGPPPAAPAGCTLKWSPSAMRDGEKAFEFLEMPDRNMVHPGVPHLSMVPEHDAYRFDSHYSPPGTVDWDRALFTGPIRNDRLRGEVRGMIGPSGELDLLDGQTWRISWSLFIPASLKGTSRFTHIMQMKFVDTKGGVSGSPVVTLTLRPGDKIELLLWLGGGSVATADLSSLHDKWLTSDLTIKIAPAGSVHWVFSDGTKTVVDKQQAGVTWPADAARLRPKWGIYRGVADGVQTSYMLISDYRAYQCQ